MKKKDIEKLLKAEIEPNIPDVLPKVLSTPVTVEEYKEENQIPKKHNFKFKYLYMGLAMCACLIIGVGILIPNINNGALLSNSEVVTNYNIKSTFEVDGYNVELKFKSNNEVLSITIVKGTEKQEIKDVINLQNGLSKVIDILIENGAFVNDKQIDLNVTSENNSHIVEDTNKLKNYFLNCLLEKGILDVTIA